MSCNNFKELKKHIGHKISCVKYGKETINFNKPFTIKDQDIQNVAIECDTCNEVILDFDKK